MRAFVRGVFPFQFCKSTAARIGVIGLIAAGLVGCASSQHPAYVGAHSYPGSHTAPKPVSERQWKVEVEEDGRPAQTPPVRRMRPEEDDPSQPWSPNYGRGTSMPPHQSPPPRHTWTKPIEASARTTALAPAARAPALSETDADNVIARAVNAHEMRRP